MNDFVCDFLLAPMCGKSKSNPSTSSTSGEHSYLYTNYCHQLTNHQLRAEDRGKLSATILLDLRAGFDVINHQLLIQKLQAYKFDENALSWFSDYLDGRQQCVQVESSFSSFLSVPWGVPQGSILGPLLFLIFINELPDIVKHFDEETEASIEESSIVVFADDNSPTTVHEDPLVLQNNIQAVGTLVTDWFKKNDISCSSEKTKLLMLGTRANRTSKIEKENIHPNINLCGDTINETTSEQILGVVVNNTITWKNHLYGEIDNEGLIPGLSKRIGMLKKIRKFVPRFKFSQTVGGMFTSRLMYRMNL